MRQRIVRPHAAKPFISDGCITLVRDDEVIHYLNLQVGTRLLELFCQLQVGGAGRVVAAGVVMRQHNAGSAGFERGSKDKLQVNMAGCDAAGRDQGNAKAGHTGIQ